MRTRQVTGSICIWPAAHVCWHQIAVSNDEGTFYKECR